MPERVGMHVGIEDIPPQLDIQRRKVVRHPALIRIGKPNYIGNSLVGQAIESGMHVFILTITSVALSTSPLKGGMSRSAHAHRVRI